MCVHVYSYFKKGCQKKCMWQSRKVLWVVLSSLFFKYICKNGTRGHGIMFAITKGKQQKWVWQLHRQEKCINHIPFTFWVCRMHTFSDNLSQNSCIWDNTVSGSFHEQTPSGREKGVCTVILLRLHPASLTHKNPTRRAIIYGMRAIGRKERSIDLKVFW